MRHYGPEVVARLREDRRESYADIAAIVNAHPAGVLNIQHEYGLFGGERGEWLIDALRAIEKPIALTMHTILPEPDETMLRVTRELCKYASAVVALSETGRDLLERVYNVDPPSTRDSSRRARRAVPRYRCGQSVFRHRPAHGRLDVRADQSRQRAWNTRSKRCATVVRRHPEVLYLILGETHPVVRRHEGESYRESLQALVAEYGLQYNVKLVDKYLEFDELVGYLEATDIYLTPYLNPVQIVSGTLAYAVGCGKAIVSTPYLYAQELLAHNRGFLCMFRDAKSIADLTGALLDDDALRRATERRAYRFGRQMTWPHVAVEYGRLFAELAPPELELVHSA